MNHQTENNGKAATLLDMKEAQRKLESNILGLITTFEECYGVLVNTIYTDSHMDMVGTRRTYSVDAKVEL